MLIKNLITLITPSDHADQKSDLAAQSDRSRRHF